MKLFIFACVLLVTIGYSCSGYAQDCTQPNADMGTIIYNPAYSVFQGCTSGGWMAFHGMPLTASAPGYFVLTNDSTNGDMDGLAGANQICVDDLTNNDWKGKDNVPSLTLSNVRAFLCDNVSCQNLQPNKPYVFAKSGSPSVGGGGFLTDSEGRGPGDSELWANSEMFGGTYDIWTARAEGDDLFWSNDPEHLGETSKPCVSAGLPWNYNINITSYQPRTGRTSHNDKRRWAYSLSMCGLSKYLICVVDPQ